MSKRKLQENFEMLKRENSIFMNFLRAKFPVFHNSNFFFRDFQFGIQKFLEKKGIEISYLEAEELAKQLSEYFQDEEFFIPVNSGTWKVNYPEFATKEPGDPF